MHSVQGETGTQITIMS